VTDSAETTSSEATPAGGSQPVAASAGASWTPEPAAQEAAAGAAAEHPELLIGAAFAGGLVLAMILKRLAG
jgi:hypothetical protein